MDKAGGRETTDAGEGIANLQKSIASHPYWINGERLLLILFVEHGLIPVGAEQNIQHPFRGSAHLFTNDFQINTGATFDDQFIMDVSDDEAVPESLHGVAEDVAADGLHDVLYELRTIGFDAFDGRLIQKKEGR